MLEKSKVLGVGVLERKDFLKKPYLLAEKFLEALGEINVDLYRDLMFLMSSLLVEHFFPKGTLGEKMFFTEESEKYNLRALDLEKELVYVFGLFLQSTIEEYMPTRVLARKLESIDLLSDDLGVEKKSEFLITLLVKRIDKMGIEEIGKKLKLKINRFKKDYRNLRREVEEEFPKVNFIEPIRELRSQTVTRLEAYVPELGFESLVEAEALDTLSLTLSALKMKRQRLTLDRGTHTMILRRVISLVKAKVSLAEKLNTYFDNLEVRSQFFTLQRRYFIPDGQTEGYYAPVLLLKQGEKGCEFFKNGNASLSFFFSILFTFEEKRDKNISLDNNIVPQELALPSKEFVMKLMKGIDLELMESQNQYDEAEDLSSLSGEFEACELPKFELYRKVLSKQELRGLIKDNDISDLLEGYGGAKFIFVNGVYIFASEGKSFC